MIGAVATGVPDSGSLQAALEYVRGKWRDFMELYPRILDLQHRAAVQAAEARELGDLETYALARASIDRLADLARTHDDAQNRFQEIASFVFPAGGGGLGAIVPVYYAAGAIALAAVVAAVVSRFNAEARVVGLLEAGQLTPDEAARILGETEGGDPLGFRGLGDAARWIVLGVAGWWAYQTFAQGRR